MNSASTLLKQTGREVCDHTARPIAFYPWKEAIEAIFESDLPAMSPLSRGWKASFVDDCTIIIPSYEFLSRDWKASLVDEASEICRECSQPGWDGYDAEALSEEAFVHARNFINLLPDGVSQPDLVPSPDGWLSFEWRSPGDGILSVTIENGVWIYATSLGQDNVDYGQVPLEEYREKFPPCIGNILSEYFLK